jgi:transposase
MEKERNRNLMLYEFKCGYSAAAATRNICRIEGAGTVKESTCRRWFAKFLNGEEGLKHQNRSGRKSPSFIVVELSFWDKDGGKLLTITANI